MTAVGVCWLCGGKRPDCGCVAAELDALEVERGRPTGEGELYERATASQDEWLSTASALSRPRRTPRCWPPTRDYLVTFVGGPMDGLQTVLAPELSLYQADGGVVWYRVMRVGGQRFGVASGWVIDSVAARVAVSCELLLRGRSASAVVDHARSEMFASMARVVRERGGTWLSPPEVVHWDDPRTAEMVFAGAGWAAFPPPDPAS